MHGLRDTCEIHHHLIKSKSESNVYNIKYILVDNDKKHIMRFDCFIILANTSMKKKTDYKASLTHIILQ